MNRQPVLSSNVASVGYDADTKTLEVAYKNGGVYQYLDVPRYVFTELRESPSVGGYLHLHVKSVYRSVRVGLCPLCDAEMTDGACPNQRHHGDMVVYDAQAGWAR